MYNFREIEEKWAKIWEEKNLYKTNFDSSKEKHYVLDMFPYPSGEGLHVGHTRIYTASDIYTRMRRMQGYNVLHPTGWDAFGLPAEQFAIKNKVHPRVSTDKNIANYRRQMKMLNLSYDFDREIDTTDHNFYKWTQFIFLEMYKKGLAYESFEPINWCPSCQTGLANEDLESGRCERCGTLVEKKPMRQWVLRITDYADRLLGDLETLPLWPEWLKELQRNWIGRSEGATFVFPLNARSNAEQTQKDAEGIPESIEIFTTRPDTIFGATYVAISAEFAKGWAENGWQAGGGIEEFIFETLKNQSEDSISSSKEKRGIFTGLYAVNPVNNEKIPVWIANYVLGGVGTGAIMAVPAHDERDFEFAKKYDLPIKEVISPETGIPQENPEERRSIVALVWNKKNNTFLSINWGKDLGGNLFVGGGLDGKEDVVECAKREIQEETGYVHLNYLAQAGKMHHNYFAHSKNVGRRIEATGILFELVDDERVATKLEENEKNKFTVEWLDTSSVEAKIKDDLHALVYNTLVKEKPYVGKGALINSGEMTGLSSASASIKIVEKFGGEFTKRYKLQDWVFSRQRYWGEPIPVVHDEHGTVYPLHESMLPVILPQVEHYEPSGTGESPLANIDSWMNVYGYVTEDGSVVTIDDVKNVPEEKIKDLKKFRRESNTMPQWAGSSWYYLRFADPRNKEKMCSKEMDEYWQPVDVYVGGAEHATRHLIYARFWHKFLYDIGVTKSAEPFMRIESVGLVLGKGGVKMSKRLGNVVNPDDVVKEWGVDTVRTYVAFMGSFYERTPWDDKSIVGCERFLDRVWKMKDCVVDNDEKLLDKVFHQTIKKVTDDISVFKFNTAVSQLMICLNAVEQNKAVGKKQFEVFIKMLAPFATNMSEELWQVLGNEGSVHLSSWPKYDENLIKEDSVVIAFQVSGKLRGTFEVPFNSSDVFVKEEVKKLEAYKKYVGENEPKKVILVPNKIVNILI